LRTPLPPPKAALTTHIQLVCVFTCSRVDTRNRGDSTKFCVEFELSMVNFSNYVCWMKGWWTQTTHAAGAGG
jgi:hypothetical protein